MLIAILACFYKKAPRKMKKAMERELSILLSEKNKDVIVYYDKKIYTPKDIVDVSSEMFDTNRFEYYCKVLSLLSSSIPKNKKVDVLFSSHNNAKFFLNKAGEVLYSPHDGEIEIQMKCLFSKIKIRNLLFDCCNGNQIDLEGVDFEKCLVCLDPINYDGVIGDDFWKMYPHVKKLGSSAKKRIGGRWCVITSL